MLIRSSYLEALIGPKQTPPIVTKPIEVAAPPSNPSEDSTELIPSPMAENVIYQRE